MIRKNDLEENGVHMRSVFTFVCASVLCAACNSSLPMIEWYDDGIIYILYVNAAANDGSDTAK